MTRACLLCFALVLAGCATLVLPPPGTPSPAAPEAEAAWARVLDSFVYERGEVDFAALSRDRADLDAYVRHVAVAPLNRPDPDEQLAHMINAYNALSMFNVIQSGIPATHTGWAKVRFFVLRRFVIDGRPMSLYAFENDVIRPLARSIDEPRIHFALNCSARSCPHLPRAPFRASTLRQQLDGETRAFFARRDAYFVDHATRTVWLSELLAFYPEDFTPRLAPTLESYAARYAPQPSPPGYAVRFIPYDWSIADRGRH